MVHATVEVEESVRSYVAGLGKLTGMQVPLAEMAYSLARRLDDIDTGQASIKGPDPTASITQALRVVLADLDALAVEVEESTVVNLAERVAAKRAAAAG
jgi:hypothetical protein